VQAFKQQHLGFGGEVPPVTGATEEYNGNSWTSVNSMNTARTALGGAGTQTAGLAFGGNDGTPTYLSATEEYNGTSWTTSPASMSTARAYLAGNGTQSLALAVGGNTGTANTGATEEYDGTSWTAVG
jgi:hypothetical protein